MWRLCFWYLWWGRLVRNSRLNFARAVSESGYESRLTCFGHGLRLFLSFEVQEFLSLLKKHAGYGFCLKTLPRVDLSAALKHCGLMMSERDAAYRLGAVCLALELRCGTCCTFAVVFLTYEATGHRRDLSKNVLSNTEALPSTIITSRCPSTAVQIQQAE